MQSLEMWTLSGGEWRRFLHYRKGSGQGEGLQFVNSIATGCQSPQTVMNAPHALGSGPHASE